MSESDDVETVTLTFDVSQETKETLDEVMEREGVSLTTFLESAIRHQIWLSSAPEGKRRMLLEMSDQMLEAINTIGDHLMLPCESVIGCAVSLLEVVLEKDQPIATLDEEGRVDQELKMTWKEIGEAITSGEDPGPFTTTD